MRFAASGSVREVRYCNAMATLTRMSGRQDVCDLQVEEEEEEQEEKEEEEEEEWVTHAREREKDFVCGPPEYFKDERKFSLNS